MPRPPPPHDLAQVILVVDDDAQLRRVLQRALALDGFVVLEAPDGEQGLRAVQRCEPPVDLVITDVEMPGLDGGAVVATLARYVPGLPVLGISGTTGGHRRLTQALRTVRMDCSCPFLPKPFELDVLRGRVRDLLGVSRPPASIELDLVALAWALRGGTRRDRQSDAC